MRKLFRFKYEPCNGTCYVWCDHLPQQLNKMNAPVREALIGKMVAAHEKLCDNPDFSFGVDMDDAATLFVAHFRTPGATEVFAAHSFDSCVAQVTDAVLKAEIPKITGACTFGDNGAESLGAEILRACVDNDFRKAHHDACPCHS